MSHHPRLGLEGLFPALLYSKLAIGLDIAPRRRPKAASFFTIYF
jgi:hypothetical protein